MARVPAVLEVPLVGGPEVPVLVVQVLELVKPLPEDLHPGCARPTDLVEKDVPLPELIALRGFAAAMSSCSVSWISRRMGSSAARSLVPMVVVP